MLAQVKAAADHCARVAYPHHDAPHGDIQGWKLWDAVWKEEEYDSPKRGAIPRRWIRTRSSFWLSSDGRLLSLETEEGEEPGWVEIPGYGWSCESPTRSWSNALSLRELEGLDELRWTYGFLCEKQYQEWRTPGSKYKTVINSVYLGRKDATQWLHDVLEQITGQADAQAAERLADRRVREERAAREAADRAAALERAIANARSVADKPITSVQPGSDLRLKFAQAVMSFRDARLNAGWFGRPQAVVEMSDDGAWAVIRVQPRFALARWWHLYADANGGAQIAREGRGDDKLATAFLGRDATGLSGSPTPTEREEDPEDADNVWFIGVFGAGAVIASGILAWIFPSSASILEGSFTRVLRVQAADVEAAMTPYAVPVLVTGIALLAIDLVLWFARARGPRREVVRAVMVAQAVLGCVAVIAAVVLGGLLLINLLVWIAEVALVVVVIGLIIVGLFAAAIAT